MLKMSRIVSLGVPVILFFCLTLAGCGYTTKSTLPSRFKTIHIKSFKNKVEYQIKGDRNIYLPRMEVDVTNAIIKQFINDGYLKVVDAEDADLVLSGELVDFERGGLRFADNEDIEEYRLNVFVSMQLYDTQEAKNKWTEDRFSGESTYFLTGPEAISEDQAIENAIKDLGHRVVERTVDDW